MTIEEYEYIKAVAQDIGYIFENQDNENNYEVKKIVIDISKNFAVTHDLLLLRNQLNNLQVSQDMKSLLYINIQRINNLSGEKLLVYTNNIYIPDDEKFMIHSKQLLGTKPLAELYHVPTNVIATKIFEINKYETKGQKLSHM